MNATKVILIIFSFLEWVYNGYFYSSINLGMSCELQGVAGTGIAEYNALKFEVNCEIFFIIFRVLC